MSDLVARMYLDKVLSLRWYGSQLSLVTLLEKLGTLLEKLGDSALSSGLYVVLWFQSAKRPTRSTADEGCEWRGCRDFLVDAYKYRL